MAVAKDPVPMWQTLAAADINVEVRPWAPKMKVSEMKTEEEMLKMQGHDNFKLYINLHVTEEDGTKRRTGLRYLMGGALDNTNPDQAHVLRTEPKPYKDAAGEEQKNVSGLQTVTAEYATWIKSLEREIVNKAVEAGHMDTVKFNKRTPIINMDYYEVDKAKREKLREAAMAAGDPVPPPLDAYEHLVETGVFRSFVMPMMADKQEVSGKFVSSVAFRMHDPAVEKAAKEGKIMEPRLTSVFQLNKDGGSFVTDEDGFPKRLTEPHLLPRGVPLFCDVNMPTLARHKVSGVWRLASIFEEVIAAHPDSELGEACKAKYGGGSGGNTAPAKVGGSSFAAHMPSVVTAAAASGQSSGLKRERDGTDDAVSGGEKRSTGFDGGDVAAGTLMMDAVEDEEAYPDDFDA